jgi:ParB family chromosome partitioning protein
MSRINTKDLAARVAQSGTQNPVADRFALAAAVLSKQATGFPEAIVSDGKTTSAEILSERFVEVPVEDIEFNPFNARRVYCETRVKELALSLAAEGQAVPGLATMRGGKCILAAGHYRLRSLRLAGISSMKLIIKDGMTDKDLYRVSFLENDERSEQSAIDNALAWKDLLDKKLYSSESELAEVTKKSLPTINKTLTILKLSSPILDLVTSDPSSFHMSTLYELLLLEQAAGPSVALNIAMQLQTGEASRRTIQELREKLQNPKDRKKKENSRQHYKIVVAGKQIGSIKEWDDGRVSFDIVLEQQALRAELMAELKRRFSIDPSQVPGT